MYRHIPMKVDDQVVGKEAVAPEVGQKKPECVMGEPVELTKSQSNHLMKIASDLVNRKDFGGALAIYEAMLLIMPDNPRVKGAIKSVNEEIQDEKFAAKYGLTRQSPEKNAPVQKESSCYVRPAGDMMPRPLRLDDSVLLLEWARVIIFFVLAIFCICVASSIAGQISFLCSQYLRIVEVFFSWTYNALK